MESHVSQKTRDMGHPAAITNPQEESSEGQDRGIAALEGLSRAHAIPGYIWRKAFFMASEVLAQACSSGRARRAALKGSA